MMKHLALASFALCVTAQTGVSGADILLRVLRKFVVE